MLGWSWASLDALPVSPDSGLTSWGSDVPGIHCSSTEDVPGLTGVYNRTLSLTLINPEEMELLNTSSSGPTTERLN